MTNRDEELLRRLQEMFDIEAEERINKMYADLIELEKKTDSQNQAKIIGSILREAHSLKGAARAVNVTDIEKVCQSLENVLTILKRKEISISSSILDTLHSAIDTVNNLIITPEKGKKAVTEIIKLLNSIELTEGKQAKKTLTISDELDQHDYQVQLKTNIETSQINQQKNSNLDTVRISAAKMDSLLLQVEEMLTIKLAAAKSADDIGEINTVLDQWGYEWTKILPEIRLFKQYTDKNDDQISAGTTVNLKLKKVLDFLKWNETFIKSLQAKINKQTEFAGKSQQIVNGITDNLMEDMKEILMLPFSVILESFPKMVRDISKNKEKEINMGLHGSDVEVDKRILEEIKDPLIHMIRNSIDHGIEQPEARIKKNKPSYGTVNIFISQTEGNKVKIIISDDGAGIELAKVKKAALGKDVITEKEIDKLSDKEILELIFISEVSTSQMITDISGRGLGLAIVREKVEKLGGQIFVKSDANIGTTFELILPVTVATIRGILINVSGQEFAVPTKNVERAIRVKQSDIKTVENKQAVTVDGKIIPVIKLSNVLEIPSKEQNSSYIQMLVLISSDKRIAIVVDEVLSEQEVLVKKFGKVLSRVRNVAGATILGSGKAVPILNVLDIMKSAVKVSINSASPDPTLIKENTEAAKKAILIVEDSITSRMLLKNILESVGYYVKTAVDGIEGFTALSSEYFDLVVSDVEMPRMNGFELTEKMRKQEDLSKIPVVLVTSMESKEDRERGIEAGANAYIVKSNFDHSNLLEVVKRLI